MEHAVYIFFLFAIGACAGSFLNVVVWRLPRGESIVSPPSHCPKCGQNLKWYDNLPVIGWIKLGGKCRFCGQPISARYPIVEAVTGTLFAGYYVAFFMLGVGPCPNPGAARGGWGAGFMNIAQHWPVYALYMTLLCVLLAASLIDAELYIIPLELLWFIGAVGLVVHGIIDTPRLPGTLNATPVAAALAAGAVRFSAPGNPGRSKIAWTMNPTTAIRYGISSGMMKSSASIRLAASSAASSAM